MRTLYNVGSHVRQAVDRLSGSRRTAARRPDERVASSTTAGLPNPDKVRKPRVAVSLWILGTYSC
jgi:hypothetical protein